MKRNPSIVLFRILCMFGVCLLHALDQGGYAGPHRGLDNLMTPSVVGFLFITGWFGIKLSWTHVRKLLSIGLCCAIVVGVVYHGLYFGEWRSVPTKFGHYFIHAWFLWCYLALMLIAPAFEPLFAAGVDKMQTLKRVVPVLFLIFCWSYAATKVPILKEWTPGVGGFGAFGVLTFIGIYLAARTCRLFEVDRLLSTKILVAIAVVSGAICWFNFMHYHSPFALMFAGAMFLLFARLPLRSVLLQRIVLFVSPSTFSIYLIHNTTMGMDWLQHFEDAHIPTYGYYPVCFAAALVFFWGSFALDLPRRLIARCLTKPPASLSNS